MKKLPTIKNPTYRGTVPSTNAAFEFRPFLIGEQKILLMALESGNIHQIYLAFRDIINACVTSPKESLFSSKQNSVVGLEELPSFDVESIFLQISAKSVGEISKVQLKCSSCEADNVVSLNLNNVVLKNKEKTKNKNSTIMLTDDIGVKMRYPSMKSLFEENEQQQDNDIVQKTLEASIECIFDATDVYPIEDVTQQDLREFLDSLSIEQYSKIESFYEDVPYLGLDVEFECSSCKAKNKTEVKGLKSFF